MCILDALVLEQGYSFVALHRMRLMDRFWLAVANHLNTELSYKSQACDITLY